MKIDKDMSQKQNLLAARVKGAQKLLAERGLDALLVSSQANRFYLTGWRGDSESGYTLLTGKRNFIITDARYTEHVTAETTGFEVIETDEGIGPSLRDILEKERLARVGYESHDLSVFQFKIIKRYVKDIRLIAESHLIEQLRAVKDEVEIERVKMAVKIAEKALKHALTFIKPGLTEKKIAWELEKYMRETGAQGTAWEPFIVAAGPHASMTHYGASDTKIKKGEMVLLDYGCVWNGYACDISRVVFVGKPYIEQKRIYNLVAEAQKIGINMVKEGKNSQLIDKKVRRFLENHTKYYYRHSLGHGVGIEVHELPYVNARRKSKLVAGNVITIEPGIYIPGWGGVRLEDMILVTKNGHEPLTNAPKKIEEVTV